MLEKPLKIEVSYRNQQISERDWQIVGGIKVYSIDALARMKANAYNGPDKIRDLYDLSFIFAIITSMSSLTEPKIQYVMYSLTKV